jgi:predicted DNA binding CopG/RHH family protein
MAEELAKKIEKTVKTTITLADSLWRDVKVYAAKKGLKLTQVVESALKEYLKEEAEKEKTE